MLCITWQLTATASISNATTTESLLALVRAQQPSQGVFQQQHVLVWCRSFTLQVHSLRKPRTVRQVHIYHCAHPLAELSELKTRPDLWRKV